MIDTTALNAFTGGDGHLKLYAPVSLCPYHLSAKQQFKSLESLNHAFQLATGWELAIHETSSSRRQRSNLKRPQMPATGKLSILDLAEILPPGIPPVSRVYCEQLVDELNHLLKELGRLRGKQFESKGEAGQCSRPYITADLDAGLSMLQSNLPFRTSNVALTPLVVDQTMATCEWFIDESGIVRFAAIVCKNPDRNSTRELIAARTAFLAECRHGASNMTAHAAVIQTVTRLFPGDSFTDVLTGTLNPLTGDITMVGVESFNVNSTNLMCDQTGRVAQVSTHHLQRGHHLVFSHWPTTVDSSAVEHWIDATVGEFREMPIDQLADDWKHRFSEAIPRIPVSPCIALAVSRPR